MKGWNDEMIKVDYSALEHIPNVQPNRRHSPRTSRNISHDRGYVTTMKHSYTSNSLI